MVVVWYVVCMICCDCCVPLFVVLRSVELVVVCVVLRAIVFVVLH